MPSITGSEYFAGIKAPVAGQEGTMPVVNTAGTGFEYKLTGDVIKYDLTSIDAAYAQALSPFMISEEVKETSGALSYAPRSRFAVLEDYFVSGFDTAETLLVGNLHWTVLGTLPPTTPSTDVAAPGVALNYAAAFSLALGPAVNTPIVDPNNFVKMSFIHKVNAAGGNWFLGMMDGVSPATSTNAVGFKGSIGGGVEIILKGPGVDGVLASGVNPKTTPQAFKMLSSANGTAIEFFIDGALVATETYTSSALLNPQMAYETPGGGASVTPMYFSIVKNCQGAMLLDGNRDA